MRKTKGEHCCQNSVLKCLGHISCLSTRGGISLLTKMRVQTNQKPHVDGDNLCSPTADNEIVKDGNIANAKEGI